MSNTYKDTKISNVSQENTTKILVDNTYLHKRLAPIAALANISVSHPIFTSLYSSDAYQNILIPYHDIDGKPTTYYLPEKRRNTKHSEFYGGGVFGELLPNEETENVVRTRWANPLPNQGKYHTQKGAGVNAYLSALYQCFINPDTKLYDTDFKTVYIVEGEFKALFLCLLGFPAIGIVGVENGVMSINKDGYTKKEFKERQRLGLTDEKHFFHASAKLLPEIEEFIKRYSPTQFIQLHDGDNFDNFKNGKSNLNRKNSFKRSVNRFNVALRKYDVRHLYAYSTSKAHKGIDDLLQGVSVAERAEIISQLKSNCEGKHLVFHSMKTGIQRAKVRRLFEKSAQKQIQVNEYLTEQVNLVYSILTSQTDTVKGIIAPTGTGKNECIYSLVPILKKERPERKIIFIYPTNAATEAKTTEYSNRELNYSKLQLDILQLDQFTSSAIKDNLGAVIGGYDVINICLNSWKWIKDFVNKGDIIVIDEIHKAITQKDVAPLPELNEILSLEGVNVITATGTPFESLTNEFEIENYYFDRIKNPSVNLQCIELVEGERTSFNFVQEQNMYFTAAKNLIDTLDANEVKVYSIYFNNKAYLHELAEHAAVKGFDTDFVYSDDEIKKEGKTWNELKQGKPISLSGRPKIVFYTSFAYESINVKNPQNELGLVAIFGESYSENIRQIAGRFRCAANVDVLFFRAAKDKRIGFFTTYKQHRKRWMKSFKTYDKIQLFLRAGMNDPLCLISDSAKDGLRRLQLDVSKAVTNEGEFNRLGCVAEYERLKSQCSTNEQIFEELAQYFNTLIVRADINKLHAIFTDEDFTDQAAENAATTEILAEAIKERKENARTTVAELLNRNVHYSLATLLRMRLKSDFRQQIRDFTVNVDVLSSEYETFRNSFILDALGVRILKQYAKRIIELSKSYDVEGAVRIATSKQYKNTIKELDTAIMLEQSERTGIKDNINGFLIDQLKNKFELNQWYAIKDIKTELQKLSLSFPHLRLSNEATERKAFKHVCNLFENEKVKRNNVAYIMFTGIVTHDSVMKRHKLLKVSTVF